MAYKYETQYDSPNFTPIGEVSATWGRPRTLEAIAIHWWGDPNTNPSYAGVIATLTRPGGVSAHFVATGTDRRVAQLVNIPDASWATNSANPFTISIECDPRCRPEDYDVVAELIAELRAEYGNLPLVPHRQFVATACPGNYDLNRLNQLAATKVADKTKDFGNVVPTQTTPIPAPIPTPPPDNTVTINYRVKSLDGTQLGAYTKEEGAWTKYLSVFRQAKIYNARNEDVTGIFIDKFDPKPVPVPIVPPAPETPGDGGFGPGDRTMLQDILRLLNELVDMFKRIFK
jgi:Negative regulator of beta-lactamase expression